MNEEPMIPVLYTCDQNYLPHAAACVASLLEYNPKRRFDINVVSSRPFGSLREKFERSFAGHGRLSLTFRQFGESEMRGYPLRIHYTVETYLRLWIGDFFANYDRALYVDPDTVFARSLDELWHTDLEERTIAAVPIPGSTRPNLLGMPDGARYFQSGLILFDLKRWRAREYTKKCLEFIAARPEMVVDADQDVLNVCLLGDWKALPYEWNVISPFFYPMHDLQLADAELQRVRRDAALIHYNGNKKPWSYFSDHPRQDDYWRFLRLTEWRDFTPADRTLANVLRKQAMRMAPESLKRVLRRLMQAA